MLTNKVAIVTGAGTGIGKEVAKLFGKNHASVVINYRSSEKEANEVKKEIEQMGSKAKTVKTNIEGTYYMTTLTLKQMEELGTGGSIVSISSSAVAQPSSGNGPYAMSKAAVELLMRSIAQNHGVNGIRCNIVAPGPTETNMVKEFFDEPKRNSSSCIIFRK